jgi:hypothetical protein
MTQKNKPNPANDHANDKLRASSRTFRGVEYTVEPDEYGNHWCWHHDDGTGRGMTHGVGGFASKEAAAADARRVINERVDNNSNHANDDNNNHANDNGERAVAPAPAGGALESLTALATVLNKIDTSAVAGRSGLPLLQFKSRENNGTWSFGQRRTLVEENSRWAINPTTFKWGYITFDNDNKPTERLVSISQPKPDITQLPDMGSKWQEEWGVNMKCLDGTDAGTEVAFKISTVGGVQAVAGLIDAVRDRLNGGQHGGKVAPILRLEKDSYQNPQYGKTWFPVLAIVDWMPLSGPAPAPEPASPPPPKPPADAAQAASAPRRRRVA